MRWLGQVLGGPLIVAGAAVVASGHPAGWALIAAGGVVTLAWWAWLWHRDQRARRVVPEASGAAKLRELMAEGVKLMNSASTVGALYPYWGGRVAAAWAQRTAEAVAELAPEHAGEFPPIRTGSAGLGATMTAEQLRERVRLLGRIIRDLK